MSIHLVDLRLHMPSLVKFFHDQGFGQGTRDEDLGYLVHTWLAAALGSHAPKPWRIINAGSPFLRVLGYSAYDAETLQHDISTLAAPSVAAAVEHSQDTLRSRPLPSFAPGTSLGFEVLVCPVLRNHGVEQDIWLSQPYRSRAESYTQWVADKIHQTQAAQVQSTALVQWRLISQLRQGSINHPSGARERKHLRRPQALVRGVLTVQDGPAFEDLIRHGIGRHRAFGYGMILLRPA